ncbi:MAG: hypothetical protein AB1503_03650 [Bacillota bacterium]|nr:hypothetical protein [Bacillota bacterium]
MDRVIYLWLQGGIALAHLFARTEPADGGNTPVAPPQGSALPETRPEPLLVCHQGRLVDTSAEVSGLRVGERRSRLGQFCPGASVVAYDAGVCGARARDFWDLGTTLSPVVDPEAENRVYLGWNTAWPERLDRGVVALAEKVVPALGYRLLGALASSKVVARGAVQWLYDALGEGRPPRLPGSDRGNRLVPVGRGGAAGWWLELGLRGEAEFWASLPVRYLWPLPEDVVERFLRLGLYRIGDVAGLGAETLSLKFGALGGDIARLARGEGPDDVQSRHPPERVERQLSFTAPVYDYGTVARGLRWLAREAAAALQQKGYGTRDLVLEVEWEGGVRTREERRLPRGEGDPARLALLTGLLWERLLLGGRGRPAATAGRAGPALPAARGRVPGGGVQAVRVVAGGLEEAWFGQLQLFPGDQPTSSEPAAERLQAVLESLRERYAREVVRVGMTPTRRQLMLSFYA